MELRDALARYTTALELSLTSDDKNAWLSAASSVLGLQRFIISYIESDGDTDRAVARLMMMASELRRD